MNLNVRILTAFAITLSVVIILGAVHSASAQGTPKFKVGDRVECNVVATYWHKGTIVPFLEDDLYNGNRPDSGYFFRVKEDGASTSGFCKAENLRPLGGAANVTPDNKPKPKDPGPVNDTPPVGDPGGNVSCPPADKTQGKSALDNAFGGAIRKSFERTPKPGEDGRVTVTIQSLNIGGSHPFRAYTDPAEARGKTVYVVKSTYTACLDYNTRIVLDKRERTFNCYKNAAGEWVCDILVTAGAEKNDESKSIDKPKH